MPLPDPATPAEPVNPEPVKPGPEPEADDAVPTEDELVRTATPGTVRHAPRFRAFLVAGGLVGAVVGLLLSTLAPGDKPDGSGFVPFLDGVNAVRTWLAVAGLLVGVLVGGLCAAIADRRSVRRRTRHP